MPSRHLTHREWEQALTEHYEGWQHHIDGADAEEAAMQRLLAEGFRPDLPRPREPEQLPAKHHDGVPSPSWLSSGSSAPSSSASPSSS